MNCVLVAMSRAGIPALEKQEAPPYDIEVLVNQKTLQ